MADTRPNIILITTDQQRADTLAAGGASWMITPHLDRLAAGGVLFAQTFGCAATCISSRAALYSGLYPHTSGIFAFDFYTGRLNWTHRLRSAGYHCVSIGKTHIEGSHHGYDERLAEQGNKYAPYYRDAETGEKWPSLWHEELLAAGLKPPTEIHQSEPDFFKRLGAIPWPLPEEWHPDEWLGNKVVRWIEHSDTRKPLFLHIGFLGPHDLYDPPQRWIDRYAHAEIPLPQVTAEERSQVPDELFEAERVCHRLTTDPTSIHARYATPESIRRLRQHYYANITLIDAKIGEILAALERGGLLRQALVIFTSDHGDNLFDHGIFYKGELYDTVVNVPLIVQAPDLVKPGRQTRDLVSHLDVAATVLDYAGVNAEDLDGISLRPVLAHGSAHKRTRVFAEEGISAGGLRPAVEMLAMIRSRTAKLIYFSGGRKGQLFDLSADPGERVNLWDRPEAQALKAQLTAELLDWLYTNLHRHRQRLNPIR